MNIGKRIFSLLVALGMVLVLAACSAEDENIPYTFSELLTTLADDTNVDELMDAERKNLAQTAEEGVEVQSYLEQVNELEEKLALAKKLESLGIKPSKDATEQIYEKYGDITAADVELLLEALNNNETSDIEKARIRAGLGLIAANTQSWIKDNGLGISEGLMLRILKAAGCEVSGLEEQYFDSCIVGPRINDAKAAYIGNMTITDPVSGASLQYGLGNTSDSALYAAAVILYDMQSLTAEEITYDTASAYCEEALEAAKIALAAGVVLEDGTISSEETSKEARQYIMEMATASSETETQEG